MLHVRIKQCQAFLKGMRRGRMEMVLPLHHAPHPIRPNPPSRLTGAAYGWGFKSPGTAADTHVTLALPFHSLDLVFLSLQGRWGL